METIMTLRCNCCIRDHAF